MNKLLKVSLFIVLVNFHQVNAQFDQTINLLDDVVSFSENFFEPAADVLAFQAASGWITSTKKTNLWDFKLGFQMNGLVVPNNKKSFQISNSDFVFFEIEGYTSMIVPTGLGNDDQCFLVGVLDGSEVRLKTPEGMQQNTLVMPYVYSELGLAYGTSLSIRYTPKSSLKGGDFKLFGIGLMHNLDQYFTKLKEKKINIASQIVYVNQVVGLKYLSLSSESININVNKILSTIDTYQFQLSASKEYKKWELMASLIANRNTFNYSVPNENLNDDSVGNDLLNQLLKTISTDSFNMLAEFSGRYGLNNNFYLQGSVVLGKLINTNFGIQYQFNNK